MSKITLMTLETRTPLVPMEFNAKTTNRAAYMAGMVQELEDLSHYQQVTEPLMRKLAFVHRKWVNPVFEHYGIEYSIYVKCSDAGVAVWGVELKQEDWDFMRNKEPVIMSALQTPPGLCACQHVEGVQHLHG